MTIQARVIAVSALKVGSGGTDYACTRFSRTVRVMGPDEAGGVTMRHETWTATLVAVAANLAAVASTWEGLRTSLCKRGEAVILTTHAGMRTLPAGGAPEASEERSIAGYPIVEMAEESSRGTWLTFTLKAEAMVPVVGVGGLVEHDYTIDESEDESGLVTITRRGTVRVVNGGSAREWVEANVIDDAREEAEEDGLAFRVRYTQGLDAAIVRYEYTAADRAGGGAGVTDARVEDNTAVSREGRLVRRVSGYATGPSAATFAEEQEPVVSATLLLTRRSISLPSLPDGRVSFEYELLSGVEDAGFPDIVIFRYDEAIASAGGGRAAVVQAFFDADPDIRMGASAPYVYTQRSTIEFIGDWADHGLTLAFSAGLLAGPVAIEKSGGQAGLRRVSLSATFISPTEIDPVPDPTEINGLA